MTKRTKRSGAGRKTRKLSGSLRVGHTKEVNASSFNLDKLQEAMSITPLAYNVPKDWAQNNLTVRFAPYKMPPTLADIMTTHEYKEGNHLLPEIALDPNITTSTKAVKKPVVAADLLISRCGERGYYKTTKNIQLSGSDQEHTFYKDGVYGERLVTLKIGRKDDKTITVKLRNSEGHTLYRNPNILEPFSGHYAAWLEESLKRLVRAVDAHGNAAYAPHPLSCRCGRRLGSGHTCGHLADVLDEVRRRLVL